MYITDRMGSEVNESRIVDSNKRYNSTEPPEITTRRIKVNRGLES